MAVVSSCFVFDGSIQDRDAYMPAFADVRIIGPPPGLSLPTESCAMSPPRLPAVCQYDPRSAFEGAVCSYCAPSPGLLAHARLAAPLNNMDAVKGESRSSVSICSTADASDIDDDSSSDAVSKAAVVYEPGRDFLESARGLPSLGSAAHARGRCIPCDFFHKGKCTPGVNCKYCHLCSSGEAKSRKKEKARALKMASRAH